jgi:hypothetical protein
MNIDDLYRNNRTRVTLTYDDSTWFEPFECELTRWQLAQLFEKLTRDQQNTVVSLLCELSGWSPTYGPHDDPCNGNGIVNNRSDAIPVNHAEPLPF